MSLPGVEAVRVGGVLRAEGSGGTGKGAKRHQEGRLSGRRKHVLLVLRAFPGMCWGLKSAYGYVCFSINSAWLYGY